MNADVETNMETDDRDMAAALRFMVRDGRVAAIDVVTAPDRLARLQIGVVDA